MTWLQRTLLAKRCFLGIGMTWWVAGQDSCPLDDECIIDIHDTP